MKKSLLLIPSLVAVSAMPFVSMVGCGKDPVAPEPEPVPESNCLTITALEKTRISGVRENIDGKPGFCPDLHYSINGGGGYKYDFPATQGEGQTLELKAGDTIKLWGNNPQGFSCSFEEPSLRFISNIIAIDGKANVSGNIMSLIDNGLCQEDTIPCNGCFNNIFRGDDIVSAENLILPTNLTNRCFQFMFLENFELTTAPELKSQELKKSCYSYMFQYCVN